MYLRTLLIAFSLLSFFHLNAQTGKKGTFSLPAEKSTSYNPFHISITGLIIKDGFGGELSAQADLRANQYFSGGFSFASMKSRDLPDDYSNGLLGLVLFPYAKGTPRDGVGGLHLRYGLNVVNTGDFKIAIEGGPSFLEVTQNTFIPSDIGGGFFNNYTVLPEKSSIIGFDMKLKCTIAFGKSFGMEFGLNRNFNSKISYGGIYAGLIFGRLKR